MKYVVINVRLRELFTNLPLALSFGCHCLLVWRKLGACLSCFDLIVFECGHHLTFSFAVKQCFCVCVTDCSNGIIVALSGEPGMHLSLKKSIFLQLYMKNFLL